MHTSCVTRLAFPAFYAPGPLRLPPGALEPTGMRASLPHVLLGLVLASPPAVLAQADSLPSDPGCPEQACPDPRWEAPRLAGAYDFLPGPNRPFQVVVEPLSWNLSAWNLGPVVALSAPVQLQTDLELDAWHLQIGAWWMPSGPKVRWRVGPELGLCLRSFGSDQGELMRDWLPALGGRVGFSWLVFERWRLEPGLRVVGELPTSELLMMDQSLDIPSWRLQFLLGIHLPTPGR